MREVTEQVLRLAGQTWDTRLLTSQCLNVKDWTGVERQKPFNCVELEHRAQEE